MRRLLIKAPAHLHAGNFDLSGDMGRLFGTLGFAIDFPLEVEVSKSEGLKTDDEWARACVKRFSECHGIGGAKVLIKKEIPRFVGLGFHTTLALSIGTALSKLYDLDLSLKEIALTMGRGAITALGVYAFERGGFIVEGGFKIERREKMIPPLIFRSPVPESWYFVVAVPEEPRKEIVELRKREEEVLKRLRPMPRETSNELSRIVLVKIIPSILEGDLNSFGEGLTSFNSKLGVFWYGGQKMYCHPVVEKGIKLMLEAGSCACQSSWGPAFYSIVEGEANAAELAEKLRPIPGDVFYTKANNRGAVVEVLDG
jgi:beta-ribofuranosylaminobenzene 5'-phosphate synthase